MAKQDAVLDGPTQLILDRLGVTPQQFYDFRGSPFRPGTSAVSDIPIRLLRPGTQLQAPFWRINLDTFHGLLGANLDSKGIGYAYKMTRNGALVHAKTGGWAQLPGDDQRASGGGVGWVPWGLHVPMAIASPTKLITAMALDKLLRLNDLTVGDAIGDFLPPHWTVHPASRALTFHQLLRHESGFGTTFAGSAKPGTADIVSAREELAAGPSGPLTPNYKNINYTILRLMFATIPGTIPGLPDDTLWDFVSAAAYAKFVNDNVFAAAGIDPRGFTPQENAARAHSTPALPPGAQVVDDTRNAGQRGWHLSIQELMLVLGEFRRGNSIVSPKRAEAMLRVMYGLDSPIATRAGTVYTKGGRTPFDPKGMDSAIYLMPDGVEFAIFVNSLPPQPPTPPGGAPPPIPTYLAVIPQFILDSVELTF